MIDYVVERVTDGKRTYDRGGTLARQGAVNAALLARLMDHPYLRRRPPKSTGREDFGRGFARDVYAGARRRRMPPLDILATVTAFTAASLAESYSRFLHGRPDEVLLCGGGSRNRTLVAMIHDSLHPARVTTTDEFGIDADAKEAVSFAILAAESIQGRPNNVPNATGATHPVVLGKFIPGR
jgi:anhydro-N-acetylmuramic acid kinase